MSSSVFNDWNLIGKTLNILQECTAVHFFNSGKSAFLVKDNYLYAYGDNHPCISYKSPHCTGYSVPFQFMELEHGIKAIGTGLEHAVLLDERGIVNTWGNNDHGQLGDGKDSRRCQPFTVGLPTITQIACGQHCTLALDSKNEVWFWGRLCLASDMFTVNRLPKRISLSAGASQISCGSSFASIVTVDNRVFTWGFNDCGQLGHGHRSNSAEARAVSGIKDVSAALCATYSIIFLTKDGRVFVTGRTGQSTNHMIPKEVKFSDKIVTISACWRLDQFGVKNDKGEIYRWGFHDKSGVPQLTDFTDIRQIYSNKCTPIVYPRHTNDPCDGLISSGNDNGKVEAKSHNKGNDKKEDKSKSKNGGNTAQKCHGNTSRKDHDASKPAPDNWYDVKIRLKDGEQFTAHSGVLSRGSNYLKILLQFGPNKKEIDLTEFEASTCRTFLKYLYTNKIDHISMREVPQLCQISEGGPLDDLKIKCHEVWDNGLTRRNVVSMYELAYRHNSERLKAMCVPKICEHMKEITQSDDFKRLPHEIKISLMATYNKGLEFFFREFMNL
ncbi:hypothetical protein O3M35_002455 [Rhynocoris fuscipes]|uniref:BTB domain-containing protein n=1 Tax=Rhynocoris fuscipes TaxID=488301 RepID=A0AAW1CRE2_9HEMI